MTTLFSPVGTADPITQLGDGPMLHIVRNRRPDRVVLYMSPAMAAFQQADERYTKAIELLAESLKMPVPEIKLIESRFEEVYRFDRYIEEFEPLLKQYAGADEALLVNASSGTAGMAQALVALGSFGRLNLELLQVVTPKKGLTGNVTERIRTIMTSMRCGSSIAKLSAMPLAESLPFERQTSASACCGKM